MPARKDIHSILIIGSGPIVIGQACEFDYSGTQAVKALEEEGYRVILVNPNPATVMTTPHIADAIYMDPLTVPYVEKIIAKERPDAILTTMGGQTGLNVTIALHEAGILENYGVKIIGASIASIELAEDRRRFKDIVSSLGLESARSVTVKSLQEARIFKDLVGLPLILRPSFTLGGFGGGIVKSEMDFEQMVKSALSASPTHEVLVEESLLGWKEFELEVMRDQHDNAIIVCSIENIDPMGVHTGDSMTVAPIQTLTDEEYQSMRMAAIEILRAVGVDCGGSNVQFAFDPETKRMVVIEMNPRVSRSSALASKATGFPIARCSAKLAVGYTLDEVLNDITGVTSSSFEPALDYCAVKVPRFEMEKFPMPTDALGTQMRSVGEVLSIGRSFIEALNKAMRSNERNLDGVVRLETIDGYSLSDVPIIMRSAHPLRICAIYSTLWESGDVAIPEILNITHFDRWFIHQLYRLSLFEKNLIKESSRENLSAELLKEAKRLGLSDQRIGFLTGVTQEQVRMDRKRLNIEPVVHFVDTCAGEFAAKTTYAYTTYGEIDEAEEFDSRSVVIVASGPNRVGQGLEFDTCCTLASLAYKESGIKTIMVNSNPETVSTDFTISDRLYLEPLVPEQVLHIVEREKPAGVVLQLGGQTPLSLLQSLHDAHIPVVGTSYESMQLADDRGRFSALITELGLHQSKNMTAESSESVLPCAKEVGFPVLLRPSHVLGGRNMAIVYDDQELQSYLQSGVKVSSSSPLLVDHFLEDAFEYDLDALCDGTSLYIGGIVQHIEAAGIHSGDSAAVFPPYAAKHEILEEMRQAAYAIARRLKIVGFMNIQFAVQHDQLYIIEVNPRASRTVPFIAKLSQVDLVRAAVGIWEGHDLVEQGLVDRKGGIGEGTCKYGWAVKEAVFSFDRFVAMDPQLGPEMKSTGEVIGIGATFGEAYAKSQIACGNSLPKHGRVCVSVNKRDRETIKGIIRELKELGFEIAATRGTARDLFDASIVCETMLKTDEGHPNIIDHLKNGRIDLLINTPMGKRAQKGVESIRSVALTQKVPYTTTTSAAAAALAAIKYLRDGNVGIVSL
ncbi:carbamoyl-phosphate synthase large subunit [Pleomorphochaeta sp. DL1XJH-081]|jgi:carbamoyl-phosphate synthase large subunit|uniref:carbamoyl-phosphate synthase large subunit n=1 Tax=Pleomorphochaeta sp. DL1XJH-081 TaxID=3409690 RepID=UPI003BB48D6C